MEGVSARCPGCRHRDADAGIDDVVFVEHDVGIRDATAIALGLIVPEAGLPTSGLAIVKPAISVVRPAKLYKSARGDRRRMCPPEQTLQTGARMIVESASPVLVVKTVVSVLEGEAESSRTNCFIVTCSW